MIYLKGDDAVTEKSPFGLSPGTDIGRRFCELAEQHARDFATRAGEHDREGSFPLENIEAMRTSGFLCAGGPEQLGMLALRLELLDEAERHHLPEAKG